MDGWIEGRKEGREEGRKERGRTERRRKRGRDLGDPEDSLPQRLKGRFQERTDFSRVKNKEIKTN